MLHVSCGHGRAFRSVRVVIRSTRRACAIRSIHDKLVNKGHSFDGLPGSSLQGF